MGYLINPPTYLGVNDFKAQPNDYDLSSYSDDNLQDLLVRASGKADSIMNRSYLPQEITEQFEGEGSNSLGLVNRPIIFVRSAQLLMPGFAPYAIPVGQLIVDYQRGRIQSWSPLIYQQLGVANVFPRNGLPILVDYAYGFGYSIPPPSFTLNTVGVAGSVPAGTYNVAVTSRTQAGESLPSLPQTVAVGTGGAFNVVVTPQLGALNYRIYYSLGPNTTLASPAANGATTFTPASMVGISVGQTLTIGFGSSNCENLRVASVTGSTFTTTAGCANAHAAGELVVFAMTLAAESQATNWAGSTVVATINSLTGSTLSYLTCPLSDSSAWQTPYAIVEAVRLIALSMLMEQNNKANRGIYQLRSGERLETWRSTEGTGGMGHPLLVEDATTMLETYAFRGIF